MHAEIDAVVVGAGPAGSAAAATLAGAGLTTVLLAGGTPTGWVETVPASVVSLLPDLGLPERSLQGVAAACRWQGADHPCLHVDRAALDALLRNAARRAGARVCVERAAGVLREGGRVGGVRTAGGQALSCRIVIDATGSRRWLGRRLALRTKPLSAPLIAWRGTLGFIPDGIEDGAARFIPRHDGWLFLATWRGRTTWTAMAPDRRPPDLASLGTPGRATAWNVSWRLARPVAGPGWLLAGEAAGRLDPAWGQGLVSAIASGIGAGRAAAACLANPAREAVCLAAYDGWTADRVHQAAATLRQRYVDNGIQLPAT